MVAAWGVGWANAPHRGVCALLCFFGPKGYAANLLSVFACLSQCLCHHTISSIGALHPSSLSSGPRHVLAKLFLLTHAPLRRERDRQLSRV